MISAPETTGSMGAGRTLITERVCLFSDTLHPGTRSLSGTYSETDTTKSGPVELLTTTRLSGRTSLTAPMMSGGLLSLSSSFLSLEMSFCSLKSSLSE